MTTKGMYKFDDGNCCPTNCFPARSLLRPKYEEGAGHWQVARQTAERSKIELLFGTKTTRIKWGEGQQLPLEAPRHEKILDGMQLIKLHHVQSPSHLCSVDISNQNFASANEEDFEQFDSVAYINATENLLTLEVFRTFPGLRELELSLNGLRNLKVSAGDFPHLEVLDLSYNNLSPEDVQALGVLSHLKVLHLTANGLHSLPLDLAVSDCSESCPRFLALEVLLLDDNHLSHPNIFVSLANLRSLKQLNLDKNGIKEVPYLHHGNNSHFSIHPLSAKSGIREGLRSRKSAGKGLRQNRSPGLDDEQPDYIILPNSKDPDRTEIIFPSPDPVTQENSPSPRAASKLSSTSFNQEFILPLPELRFLSLANNQIEHEEDLLAVALFPSLTELTFHSNPFTISRSGDPPLLTSFLQNKLGIKLVRKKMSKLEKPRIFIPVKAHRKVKSKLPKVRKHPLMLEAPQEATSWQLWTGTELDPDHLTNLNEPEPLPPIGTFSVEKSVDEPRPSSTILPLPEEAEHGLTSVSIVVSPSEQLTVSPAAQPSLDQLLAGHGPPVQSSVERILFETESLLSRSSFLAERTQLGLAAPDSSFLTEQDLSKPLAQEAEQEAEQDLSKPLLKAEPPSSIAAAEQACGPPHRSPSAEPGPLAPAPPPNSPLPEQGPEGFAPAAGPPAAEPDPSSVSSPAEPDPPQPSPPPSLPWQEQDLSHPVPPTRSPPAEEQHLSGAYLPTSPLLDTQEQLELVPLHNLPSQAEDLIEPVSPTRSPTEEQDLPESEILPCHKLPSAEPDQLESVPLPSSPLQEQTLPEPVPPAESPAGDQNLAESLLPSPEQNLSGTSPLPKPPPEEQDSLGPVPLATSTFQEPNSPEHEPAIRSPSVQQEPSWLLPPASSPSMSQESSETLDAFTVSGKTSAKLLPLHSSSRDLYLLLTQAHQSLLALEQSDECSSDVEMFSSSSEESLERRKSESFFMTQVADASSSQLKKETSPRQQPSSIKTQQVPEKYKGYEELLDGDTGNDPDFIEPVGIQQNVKALKKALQYPRVYRESKARLDSLQKPFVPMEKKVLRVPAPQPHQTKVQKLEEILLKMRTPINILEVPLVCILRRRKSNWQEYREALALLKEFQQKYKAAVATCDLAGGTRTTGKTGTSVGKICQSQTSRDLAGIKASRQQLEESSPQATKEDKGI